MGCISSKTDINDRHPNIFQVTNVNDQGKKINSGKLQVTESALVFYQRGKKPTKWPLRSLRKYGFDTETFTFECGRRSPTGHGIYAFKCKKAELLFNVVQQYITGNATEDTNPHIEDFHAANGQVSVSRRPASNSSFEAQADGYLQPVSVPPEASHLNSGTPQVNSGLFTPQVNSGLFTPPADASTERNNNKRDSLVNDPSYLSGAAIQNGGIPPQYINLGGNDVVGIDQLGASHVYMNVDVSQPVSDSRENHCYANIDTDVLDELRPTEPVFCATPLCYAQLDQGVTDEVNYAELDLDRDDTKEKKTVSQVPPEGNHVKEKYVTIDFQKTTALIKSKNPSITVEEGSRKTRHNSSINYNSSISD